MSLDEDAEAFLRERWSRSQRHITMFSVVLPALQLLLCTVIVVMAGGGGIWPTAIPLVPVAIAAVALRQWLRRQTPLDPLMWLPAAFLVAGVQLLSVVVPANGIATSSTLDAPTGPAILQTSTHDQWLIPLHDADLVADLIQRRQALWLQGNL